MDSDFAMLSLDVLRKTIESMDDTQHMPVKDVKALMRSIIVYAEAAYGLAQSEPDDVEESLNTCSVAKELSKLMPYKLTAKMTFKGDPNDE